MLRILNYSNSLNKEKRVNDKDWYLRSWVILELIVTILATVLLCYTYVNFQTMGPESVQLPPAAVYTVLITGLILVLRGLFLYQLIQALGGTLHKKN